jgi:hypothetical protein
MGENRVTVMVVSRIIRPAVAIFTVLGLIFGGSVVSGLTTANADAITFYVSPSGMSSAPGTESLPTTLPHAQQLVRASNQDMTSDITIIVEAGTYRLASPLAFGSQDSGTNGFSVNWEAAPGTTPTISGAVQVSNWKESNPSLGMWSAPIPDSLNSRQMYVNGVRATLASGPAPSKLSKWWNGFSAANSLMSHWRNPSQIDLVFTGQMGLMAEPICPVGHISGRLLTMAEPCWANSTHRRTNYVGFGSLSAPTYLENAFELLTKPGQFYLDSHLHRMYYIPRPGQDMTTADVEVPALQTLVSGSGTPTSPIENITFSGIQFAYATWMKPGTKQGFSEVQAGYTLTGTGAGTHEGLCHLVSGGTCPFGAWTREPGNIQFANDHQISFSNDQFFHLGAAGLNLDDGSQNDTVSDCVFTDISGNGIELGGVDQPTAAPAAQTVGNTISNSHIYDIGMEFHGAVGIFVGYAADTIISHNQLDHLPYTGISLGWGGWEDKIHRPSVVNFSHDNVVEDNLIYDFVQTMSDGGGVYTQGLTGTSMANGEQIVGNEIYGQLHWSFALHSDDGATFITNKDNILFDNEYDWSGNHTDYQPGKGSGKTRDAQAIVGNYWQQGDPGYSSNTVTDEHNHVILDASQAPPALLAQVGIQPAYQSVLSWHPPGNQVPNAPTQPNAVYAFQGSVYLSWLPSFAEGDSTVISYTVDTCHLAGGSATKCMADSPAPLTVPRSQYDQYGYAVINALVDGQRYTFTVTANSDDGSSTPSLSSNPLTPRPQAPKVDDRVTDVYSHSGNGAAVVIWYPPYNTFCKWWTPWCKDPALAYKIQVSTGATYMSTGLNQLIVSNHSGRSLFVVPNLKPGSYTFTVRAWDPAGFGPPFTSGRLKIG